MSEPSFTPDMTEFMSVLRRFLYLRRYLKVVIPDDLLHIEAQIQTMHLHGRDLDMDDYNLLFDVGAILALQQEPITMGELSRALDVSLSTATHTVDWLVQSGYAERQPDPDDRRVVRVALTAVGQALNQTMETFLRRRLAAVLQPLTAEERRTLVTLLNKLAEGLERDLRKGASR
jgi:DNA-binding MarR family transcriptional regulator